MASTPSSQRSRNSHCTPVSSQRSGNGARQRRTLKLKAETSDSHDARIVEALRAGTIKLLSCEWLRSRTQEWKMERMQDLSSDAFLSCQDAASIFALKSRRVATLSYGWLTPAHPDPHGENSQLLVGFLRCEAGARFDGLFWDFGSLPQKDASGARTSEEHSTFQRGLHLMANLYASARGSSVIRLTNIPQRPDGYEGAWNETPYMYRGWCLFEFFCAMIQANLDLEIVSNEDLLEAPSVDTSLPPKLIDVVSGEAVAINEDAPDPSLFSAELGKARFTGKGDRSTVEALYLQYYLSVGVAGRAAHTLSAARESARRVFIRVRVFVTIGSFTFFSCFLAFFLVSFIADIRYGPFALYAVCSFCSALFSMFCIYPRDDDRAALKKVSCVLAILFLVGIGLNLYFAAITTVPVIHFRCIGWAVSFAFAWISLLPTLPRMRGRADVLQTPPLLQAAKLLRGKSMPRVTGQRLELKRVWYSLRLSMLGYSIFGIGSVSWMAAQPYTDGSNGTPKNYITSVHGPSFSFELAAWILLLLCAIFITPRSRGKIRRWMSQLFQQKKGSAESEQAAIDALMSGGTLHDESGRSVAPLPVERVKSGQREFRLIEFGRLREGCLTYLEKQQHLAQESKADPPEQPEATWHATWHKIPRVHGTFGAMNNVFGATDTLLGRAIQELLDLSVPSTLGDGDAYVSHSARDPLSRKLQALELWCAEFEMSHGRWPRLWIDIACAPEGCHARADVATIPLCVSGCSSLLVLAGSTYTHSLWAVMELFCFLRMGGTVASVTVVPVTSEEDSVGVANGQHWNGRSVQQRAIARVSPQLSNFEVHLATCEHEEDRQRLLACVESGFGSHGPFNQLMRSLFDRMQLQSEPTPRAIRKVRLLAQWRLLRKSMQGLTPRSVVRSISRGAQPSTRSIKIQPSDAVSTVHHQQRDEHEIM